jgi:hypothetical protein
MSGIVIGPNAYATSVEPVRYVGELFSCAPGTSEHLVLLDRGIRLRGGTYWVDGASVGDRLSLSVVDGAGQELARYCDRLPVAPWAHLAEILAPTAGLIPAGLSLRVLYENAGAATVRLGISLSWFEV